MVRGSYNPGPMNFRRGNRSIKGINVGTRNFSVGRARQQIRGGYRQATIRNNWNSSIIRGNNSNRFRQNQSRMRTTFVTRRGQFSARHRYGNSGMMRSSNMNRGRFTARRGMNRGRASRRMGGRGGVNARGRGGRGRGGASRLSKETLDEELDAYMGDDVQKRRLDNDLDTYFGRGGGSSANQSGASSNEGSNQNEPNNIGMEVNMDGSL